MRTLERETKHNDRHEECHKHQYPFAFAFGELGWVCTADATTATLLAVGTCAALQHAAYVIMYNVIFCFTNASEFVHVHVSKFHTKRVEWLKLAYSICIQNSS